MNTFGIEVAPWGGWSVFSINPLGGRRSTPCKTEAEARVFWDELHSITCRECGDPIWARHDTHAERMLGERLCSTCYFWTHLPTASGIVVIADGCHYEIGETEQACARRCGFPTMDGRLRSDYRHVLGHGGAEFTVVLNDGRRIVTTNLWTQGPIPEHFRDRLPDNARFERRDFSRYVGAGSASA